MATYSVSNSGSGTFYVYGLPTGRMSCVVESKRTADRAEAQQWADRMNAGEDVPEAGCSMYADD